jgi:hypothetical protein
MLIMTAGIGVSCCCFAWYAARKDAARSRVRLGELAGFLADQPQIGVGHGLVDPVPENSLAALLARRAVLRAQGRVAGIGAQRLGELSWTRRGGSGGPRCHRRTRLSLPVARRRRRAGRRPWLPA